jgi:hypothetical protein
VSVIERLSNKRLKLAGLSFYGIGVVVPWRAQDFVHCQLRRRANRPQLKREPLGRSRNPRESRDLMRRAFAFLALGFAIGAGYHLIAALLPAFGIAGPRWRHILFVGIDLLTAWYMLRRPLWLLPAFLVLVAQQVYNDGGRIWRWWHGGRRGRLALGPRAERPRRRSRTTALGRVDTDAPHSHSTTGHAACGLTSA